MKVCLLSQAMPYVLVGLLLSSVSINAETDTALIKERLYKTFLQAKMTSKDLYEKLKNVLAHKVTQIKESFIKQQSAPLKSNPTSESIHDKTVQDTAFNTWLIEAKDTLTAIGVSIDILNELAQKGLYYLSYGTDEQKIIVKNLLQQNAEKINQLFTRNKGAQFPKALSFNETQALEVIKSKTFSHKTRQLILDLKAIAEGSNKQEKIKVLTFLENNKSAVIDTIDSYLKNVSKKQLTQPVQKNLQADVVAASVATLDRIGQAAPPISQAASASTQALAPVSAGTSWLENPAILAAAPKAAMALLQTLSGNPAAALKGIEAITAQGILVNVTEGKRFEPFHTAIAAVATGASLSSIPLYVATSEISVIATNVIQDLDLINKVNMKNVFLGVQNQKPSLFSGLDYRTLAKDVLITGLEEAVVGGLLWSMGMWFSNETDVSTVLLYAAARGAVRGAINTMSQGTQQVGALVNMSESLLTRSIEQLLTIGTSFDLTALVPIVCKDVSLGIVNELIAQLGGYTETGKKIAESTAKAVKERTQKHAENISQVAQKTQKYASYISGQVDALLKEGALPLDEDAPNWWPKSLRSAYYSMLDTFKNFEYAQKEKNEQEITESWAVFTKARTHFQQLKNKFEAETKRSNSKKPAQASKPQQPTKKRWFGGLLKDWTWSGGLEQEFD